MKYLPSEGRRHTVETRRRIRICETCCRRNLRFVINSPMPANSRRTSKNRILVSSGCIEKVLSMNGERLKI